MKQILHRQTYYLDDPENIEAFQTLAQKKSDIDFETYTLDANDRLYQQNVSSLENTQSFATMFLIVVIGAGSAILCLILILTIRSRYYEIGVFLSLGQSKVKIILQQLFEMLLIAAVAFVISLGTGKLVSNVVGNMLESGTNNNQVQMQMPEIRDQNNDSNNTNSTSGNDKMFDQAFNGPENTELDVSLTTTTVMQLAGITIAICLVSIAIPSAYVLRLSPREILVKKGIKAIKKKRMEKKEVAKSNIRQYEVKTSGVSNEGLTFKIGEYFKVLEADGDAVLIEKIGDENNPYFVSAELLKDISDYKKLGGFDMGFFGDLFKSEFEKWVEGASHEELFEAYEEERQKWIREGYNGGTGEKTAKMNRLNTEISKRVAEEWENDPRRNKDPNFRWTDANRWDKD